MEIRIVKKYYRSDVEEFSFPGIRRTNSIGLQASFYSLVRSEYDEELTTELESRLSGSVLWVRKSKADFLVILDGEEFHLHLTQDSNDFLRLNSGLIEVLGGEIFTESLESFFSNNNQSLEEKVNPYIVDGSKEKIENINPFKGVNKIYFQEIFFHIPFLIANHFNANQEFKEAKWWYERIFDPMGIETPEIQNPTKRNWNYIEFRGYTSPSLREILLGEGNEAEAISLYREDPFNPHAIANIRLSAYQKAIVMKYIDNLIDWGDYLFSQDTAESINEATMLYVLAYDILGNRPTQLGKCDTVAANKLTYSNLKSKMQGEFLSVFENHQFYSNLSSPYEQFGNALNREELKKESTRLFRNTLRSELDYNMQFNHIVRETLGFCVPNNKTLLAYWDKVEDRLHKIRNCMNISGVQRALPLFQPSIDPLLLVRARAVGLSIEEALQGPIASNLVINYRFRFLVEKARQFIQTIQDLGNSLLLALEKSDLEELNVLRSKHERHLLDVSTNLKDQQIEEAKTQKLSLVRTRDNAESRAQHFAALISKRLLSEERKQQRLKVWASREESKADDARLFASFLRIIPQFGSPFAMTFGGEELGHSADMFASTFSANAGKLMKEAEATVTKATFKRREEEWKFQKKIAEQEVRQLNKQIVAAEIRIAIAEKDLEIHERNSEQTEELYNFYQDKFTNLSLYNFLSTSLSRLYRQAYDIALGMAKAANAAFQFELYDQLEADESINFIKSDHWDSRKAGLLAGDRLLLQLQQMERAYLEKNSRRIEITQSFSMRQLAPEKLLLLKAYGTCEGFTIPEVAFDLIYPGYYKRLIKSVRITIPCIVGPYTNIGCTLSLTDARVRVRPSLDNNDDIMKRMAPGITQIATSSGQNDDGQFDLNFRDEMYLPFEGAGAWSTWSMELPSAIRVFDYNTISDVIFHISYTAAHDGGTFKEKVNNRIREQLNQLTGNSLQQLFSLRHDFPNEWYRYQRADPIEDFEAIIRKDFFPYWTQGLELKLGEVQIFAFGLDAQKHWFDEIALVGEAAPTLEPGELNIDSSESSLRIPANTFNLENQEIVVKDWMILVNYTLAR